MVLRLILDVTTALGPTFVREWIQKAILRLPPHRPRGRYLKRAPFDEGTVALADKMVKRGSLYAYISLFIREHRYPGLRPRNFHSLEVTSVLDGGVVRLKSVSVESLGDDFILDTDPAVRV